MHGHFAQLLAVAAAQPEIRVSKLKSAINIEPRAKALEAGENGSSSLKKLMSMKRKAVDTSRPVKTKMAYPKLEEAIQTIDQAPIIITT
jgi:hypothetical protein